jgi:hypothetical protein
MAATPVIERIAFRALIRTHTTAGAGRRAAIVR